jgi:hypothetical protein
VTEIALVLPDGSIVTLRDDDDRNDDDRNDDDRNPRPSPGAVPGESPPIGFGLEARAFTMKAAASSAVSDDDAASGAAAAVAVGGRPRGGGCRAPS